MAPGSHALVVADRAGWHGSDELTVSDNITLLPLPSASPELNPQENVREWLRKNKLALSVFDNYDHIVETCCKVWNDFIADPATVASVTRRDWAKNGQNLRPLVLADLETALLENAGARLGIRIRQPSAATGTGAGATPASAAPLAADVVGYSSLMRQDEEGMLAGSRVFVGLSSSHRRSGRG